jgi:rhodanese-related sulfurtransferase
MQAKELLQRIQSNKAPVIVDPRSSLEFSRGHIPGAINTPVVKIIFRTARLPEDKNVEMVIACMHGQRAWMAKKLLALQGYRNMALLDGYLEEWVKAGLPWEKAASRANALVPESEHQPEEEGVAESSAGMPKLKETALGLYVTAEEAYEKWKAAPEKVKIIDVRTPEEFLFVGHPPMAWKIPVAIQSYEWDADKKQFPMKPLPDFVSRVSEVAKPDETLLVMCRSGGRSAIAVNMLAKAGFKHAYNIIDGMEGDAVEDPDSVFLGQRLKNGWKNSGCPWTYKLTSDQMVLPRDR